MWSLGVVLFHLVTGRPLWLTDKNDRIGEADMHKLAGWSSTDLKNELAKAVKMPSTDQLLAFSLLVKLLEADPTRRLCKSCRLVYLHAADA